MKKLVRGSFIYLFFILFSLSLYPQQKNPVTLNEIMKFKQISGRSISDFGNWISVTAKPDRGNGETQVISTSDQKAYMFERADRPVFSTNEKWVAMTLLPDFAESEKDSKNKPKNGLLLLNTMSGDTTHFADVTKFEFSKNAEWLAIHFFKADKKDKEKSDKKNSNKAKDDKNAGTTLALLDLTNNKLTSIPFVVSFAHDSLSNYIAYTVCDTSYKENGLYLRDLKQESLPEIIVNKIERGNYTNLSWYKSGSLAYLQSEFDKKNKAGAANLFIWDKSSKEEVASKDAPDGWTIPAKNSIRWSKDGKRLFFAYKPKSATEEEKEKDSTETDIYDVEEILSKRELDVWHWNDPFIKTHEQKQYNQIKDRTYPAVYHLTTEKAIALTDLQMPRITHSDNPNYVLGRADVPYQREATWDGRYDDVYLVNLNTGKREKILTKHSGFIQISPTGKFILYFSENDWHLYNVQSKKTNNLTKDLSVPFQNEDHDYPSIPPSYRIGGWTEEDQEVLIYDKFDIWKFSTRINKAINITDGKGRKTKIIFRIIRTDRDAEFFKANEKLLLSAYNDLKKFTAFYSAFINKEGVWKILEEDIKFTFRGKAKNAKKFMYTRESYVEFPDIWVSDNKFQNRKKLTDYQKQVDRLAWGSTELIDWKSIDGKFLQGIVYKPANYKPGKKYPVVVYYYRFRSQALYNFPDVVINHRPNHPLYLSNDYIIFQPDIRFEVGRPGFAATKCLVPGVQKLIDLGFADPNGVGLHGHSWSGYQTAFMVTQTDIFACAVAGAPVSNMTSAYGGIRWQSGLARQFQYEKTQSRIGGSLWEYPERYIENSPLFFADRINTPLLIQHGDADGAVPWYQSIELYLAMRRLDKDCVFLQYRKEPHHLRKYANKMDYTIKMMQYFDHYLKGEPAADWIIFGVPYTQ